MYRFFVSQEHIHDKDVTITGRELHHLKDVLRISVGDTIVVLDGSSMEYSCKIEELSEVCARALIISTKSIQSPSPEITVVQAIPKLDRFDYVVQKSVELGVTRIIPVVTKRTIVQLDDKKIEKKMKRWNNIIQEATKQCKRADLMQLEEPMLFKKIFNEDSVSESVCFLGHLGENTVSFKDALQSNKNDFYSIFIGPEGDFTENEIQLAEANNCISVNLLPTVLRTDTAPVYMASAIMYEYSPRSTVKNKKF